MSISNRITLAQLREMDPAQVKDLSADDFATLQDALTARKNDLKILEDKVHKGLVEKYGERAAEARRLDGKMVGTVSFKDDGRKVKVDLPKKVVWDQAKLRAMRDVIVNEWKENPEEYLIEVLSVPERKYNAWPEALRKNFEPARTLAHGNIKIEVE